jgi:hypothetical protein
MATLPKPVSAPRGLFPEVPQEPIPPAGTFIATVLDIRDAYGVERKKFDSEEMEKQDVTQFLFGFRDQAWQPHKITSREMKISGSEKSGLFKLLSQILGKAPAYGVDYCALKGQQCLITITHEPKRDGTGSFPRLLSLSPVPAGMGAAPAPAARRPMAPPAPVKPPEDDIPF